MNGINSKLVLESLINSILNTRFEDIDTETIDSSKKRAMDMVGCAIGGAGIADMIAFINLAKRWGGRKEATILGHGIKIPVPEAAMINCLMGRSFDWGPLTLIVDGNRFPTHTSETTVLTAFTVGESKKVSGKELLTALITGDDLAARLWLAAGERAQPGQESVHGQRQNYSPRPGFEPWGTITTFAATAIAGRLLGLDLSQMKNAFGIALTMISGAGSGLWDGATVFKLSQGTSSKSGILAAYLALAGWTGIEDPLFGQHGSYYTVFDNGCNLPEILTSESGKKYYTEVVFKPYPGGRPTHAPIEAALALSARHEFKTEDIAKVILRTSPPATAAHYAKPYKIGEYPTGDALFSYKYSVANALVRKHALNQDYTAEYICDPSVQTLISKIVLEELDRPQGVELSVILKDGREISKYVPVALGEPTKPLSDTQLKSKFMTQVEFSGLVNKQNAGELLDMLENLEKVDNIAELAVLASK